MNREELIARMRELEPWHFDMEVRDGVRTSEGNPEEYGDVDQRGAPLIDPWHLAPLFDLLYPEKLGGKHWMYTDSDNLKLLRMCDDCRVTAQMRRPVKT